jgi:hypothetical protein
LTYAQPCGNNARETKGIFAIEINAYSILVALLRFERCDGTFHDRSQTAPNKKAAISGLGWPRLLAGNARSQL